MYRYFKDFTKTLWGVGGVGLIWKVLGEFQLLTPHQKMELYTRNQAVTLHFKCMTTNHLYGGVGYNYM